ncbi:MAG: hypothetical protein SFU85_00585 [Candidatus Methylacidiphilales bacterium]|nr:hypothetical protein [Candidatus Methylacidiphilales bacterium]
MNHPFFLGAVCCLVLFAIPGSTWAKKASDIKIKKLEFQEHGYRYNQEQNVWADGLPTVLVRLECRDPIPKLQLMKVYYYDNSKKLLGTSPNVTSYFEQSKSGRITGFKTPAALPEKTDMEFHFTPPKDLVFKDVSRILLVMTAPGLAKAEMDPAADPLGYEFDEKAQWEQGLK